VRRNGLYPKESRRDVCSLVLVQHHSASDALKELNRPSRLYNCGCAQSASKRGERDEDTMTEPAELEHLHKENRHLRQGRDLLKRSMAFSVKEVAQ